VGVAAPPVTKKIAGAFAKEKTTAASRALANWKDESLKDSIGPGLEPSPHT
jgi:hypothetical protein